MTADRIARIEELIRTLTDQVQAYDKRLTDLQAQRDALAVECDRLRDRLAAA